MCERTWLVGLADAREKIEDGVSSTMKHDRTDHRARTPDNGLAHHGDAMGVIMSTTDSEETLTADEPF